MHVDYIYELSIWFQAHLSKIHRGALFNRERRRGQSGDYAYERERNQTD